MEPRTAGGADEPARRDARQEVVFTRVDAGDPALGRRAHPRYAAELDVSLGTDHNFYAGFTENLSAGGVFVATHMLKAVGEWIDLTIYLPEREEPLRTRGEVRWLREYNPQSDAPPGMGIRFVELDPASQQAIADFLAHRPPLFFDDD